MRLLAHTENIVNDYKAGSLSVEQIAVKYATSRSAIYKILKRYNIPTTRCVPYSAELIQTVCEMKRAKKRNREIANTLGIPRQRVSNILLAHYTTAHRSARLPDEPTEST